MEKTYILGKKGYFCKVKECDFVLWKKTEGAAFTEDMAKDMLSGVELKDVVCFTKKGKEYKCGFRMSGENLVKISYGGQK